MNLDIANIVMNIGEASKGFDWGDFWTALFGAGFGAYAAYRLNIRKQNSDEKQNKFIKLNKLINLAQMFSTKTCAYFRNLYNSKISNTALSLDIVNVDEQEFSFLGNYNIHFLYFINYFNQLINHLKTIVFLNLQEQGNVSGGTCGRTDISLTKQFSCFADRAYNLLD